jgi:Yip1 domain
MANARFCGSCGQQIEASAATSIAAPAAAHASAAMHAGASKAWAAAAASAPGLISRIKNIVLTPKAEWPVIAPETTSVGQLYAGYVLPLGVLAALIGFVRMSILGVNTGFGTAMRMPIGSGLTYTVVMFISVLVMVFLVGLIINALAPTFSGQRDQRQALKTAAYSLTPGMLSSVLALSPILATLLQLLAGLYGIYVLYLGLPVLMQSPKEKSFGYTASVVICTFLIGVAFVVISSVAHIGGRQGFLGATPSERAADQAAAREQGAATVGNAIGNALGTDAQGKAGLTAALSNITKLGEQSQGAPSSAAPAANSTPAVADNTQNAQNPLGAASGLMTALGGALGGARRVETVDFKTLTPMLPTTLPGMKRTSAQGENQGAIGVKTSSAKADYHGADGNTAHIEISDLSGVSGLMDLANGLVQNTTSESDSSYEKDVQIGGRTVHEKYDANSKRGEVSVMLAKRFSVEISGAGLDMHTLEQSLGQVDLSRLESMKDAGAQAK